MTDPDGTAQRSADARRWAVGHADELIGRPLPEAESAVQAAGLRVKVVRPVGWVTLEYGIGRIVVEVDDEERVTGLRAG